MAKGIKRITRKLLKSNTCSELMSFLLYLYTKFVYYTTLWNKDELSRLYQVWTENDSIILISWHGRATMAPCFWDHQRPMNALVSLHNDGKLMARLLEHFGLGIIGGSTNSNAKAAAVSLMKALKNHQSICIIPDGPIGPGMHMNMSPLYFAQKSGKPIIGITYSCKRAKIFSKSWDEMMLPFPFNRGIVKTTRPFFIPKDADDAALEALRLEIEQEMVSISMDADISLNRTPVRQGTRIKTKKNHPVQEG